MYYTHSIHHCTFPEAAVTEHDFLTALSTAQSQKANVTGKDGTLAAIARETINGQAQDIILRTAEKIRKNFKHLVILGTGGSTLCGRAFSGVTEKNQRYGHLPTKLHYVENVDPHSANCMLDSIDINESFFLVISKSGSTMETLAQFALCLEAAQRKLDASQLKHHFLCISDPRENILRRVAAQFDIPVLEHVEDIGGRFSIFTNVGLIPAAVAGMDIVSLLKGAHATIHSPAPLEGALLQTLWMEAGHRNAVLMPYVDRLWHFTSWIKQVWAESLGKEGKGSTPIRALGTIDQHSQLQLYLDGPKDKFFTFFALENHPDTTPITSPFLLENDMDYLYGKSFGEILNASCIATAQTLAAHQVPVRTITLNQLDDASMGAIAMHFMLETLYAAALLNINPFGQPAVEQGKLLARKALKEKRTVEVLKQA